MSASSTEASQAGTAQYDIFLSYSSKDARAVAQVQQFLERTRTIAQQEVTLRLFRDHTDLRGGELTAEILTAIYRSAYLMLCCSKHTATSRWVQLEVEQFLASREPSRIILGVLGGPKPSILPTPLAEKQLKELNLRNGWFFGWPRSRKEDELLRAVAKVADIDLRLLIDWEHRRRKESLLRGAVFLMLAIVLLAIATTATIQVTPPADWTKTELESLDRSVGTVQIVEREQSKPFVRTYSSWTQQSVNRTIFDEGMYKFYVADLDMDGRVTGTYDYIKFTRDREEGIERTYSAGNAIGTLETDVAALNRNKGEDKIVLSGDLLKLHPQVRMEKLEEGSSIDPELRSKVEAATKFYESGTSAKNHDGRESARAKLVSLTLGDDEIFAAFAGYPVFDMAGKVESLVRNFGAVSRDRGQTWEELSLPQEIKAEHFKLNAIATSARPGGLIAVVFRPIDGGNSQTNVPRVFLRGVRGGAWIEVPCGGFDSASFDVRGVTADGGIVALESGRVVFWRELTYWERFLKGLGRRRGSASPQSDRTRHEN